MVKNKLKYRCFNCNNDYFKFINKRPEIDVICVKWVEKQIHLTYVQPVRTSKDDKIINRREINKMIPIKGHKALKRCENGVRTKKLWEKIM